MSAMRWKTEDSDDDVEGIVDQNSSQSSQKDGTNIWKTPNVQRYSRQELLDFHQSSFSLPEIFLAPSFLTAVEPLPPVASLPFEFQEEAMRQSLRGRGGYRGRGAPRGRGRGMDDGFRGSRATSDSWTQQSDPGFLRGSGGADPNIHPEMLWVYKDPQGNIQGPFGDYEMNGWFSSGYFADSLQVKRVHQKDFSELSSILDENPGRKSAPFFTAPGAYPPSDASHPMGSVMPSHLETAISSIQSSSSSAMRRTPSYTAPDHPEEQHVLDRFGPALDMGSHPQQNVIHRKENSLGSSSSFDASTFTPIGSEAISSTSGTSPPSHTLFFTERKPSPPPAAAFGGSPGYIRAHHQRSMSGSMPDGTNYIEAGPNYVPLRTGASPMSSPLPTRFGSPHTSQHQSYTANPATQSQHTSYGQTGVSGTSGVSNSPNPWTRKPHVIPTISSPSVDRNAPSSVWALNNEYSGISPEQSHKSSAAPSNALPERFPITPAVASAGAVPLGAVSLKHSGSFSLGDANYAAPAATQTFPFQVEISTQAPAPGTNLSNLTKNAQLLNSNAEAWNAMLQTSPPPLATQLSSGSLGTVGTVGIPSDSNALGKKGSFGTGVAWGGVQRSSSQGKGLSLREIQEAEQREKLNQVEVQVEKPAVPAVAPVKQSWGAPSTSAQPKSSMKDILQSEMSKQQVPAKKSTALLSQPVVVSEGNLGGNSGVSEKSGKKKKNQKMDLAPQVETPKKAWGATQSASPTSMKDILSAEEISKKSQPSVSPVASAPKESVGWGSSPTKAVPVKSSEDFPTLGGKTPATKSATSPVKSSDDSHGKKQGGKGGKKKGAKLQLDPSLLGFKAPAKAEGVYSQSDNL